MASFRIRNDCRLCGEHGLEKLLELTPTPPANEYLSSPVASVHDDKFPLGLWVCRSCGHVQLPVVVSPERLFRDYAYVSGTSSAFVDHFRRYAESIVQRFAPPPGSLVVDVGSNDGTLLRFFKGAEMSVLGVDPAMEIAGTATGRGIETIPEFLTPDLARNLTSRLGHASVVTANNVFAHVDDLKSLALAVRDLLTSDGVFVFEVQYLVDMCRGGLFDMVYHEHLSYHHVAPLVPFLESVGLHLFDVERVQTHGGSIRCFVDAGVREATPRVGELCGLEFSIGLGTEASLREHAVFSMGERIASLRSALSGRLSEIRKVGGRVAAYGAPAKATTLIHHFGLTDGILDYVVDDNPLKQGKYLPGTKIQIFGPDRLELDPPDYLLILAWNFAEQIVAKCDAFRRDGGRILVPLPELKEM